MTDKSSIKNPIDILPAYGVLDLKYNRMVPRIFIHKDSAYTEKTLRGTDHIIVSISPALMDDDKN